MTPILLVLSSLQAFAAVPEGSDVGFGLGIQAPTGTLAPNVVSARIRAMDNLVIEPGVDLSFSTNGSSQDIGDETFQTRDSTTNLGGSLGLRYHVAERGPVALVFGVTPFFRATFTGTDPDVDANDDETRSTSLAAGGAWTLGTVFQPGGPWTLSADVSNPFLTFSRSATRQPNDDVTVSSGVDGGLRFAPTARFMAHLWF